MEEKKIEKYRKSMSENLVKLEDNIEDLKMQLQEYRKKHIPAPAKLYEQIHQTEKMIFRVKGELKKCQSEKSC